MAWYFELPFNWSLVRVTLVAAFRFFLQNFGRWWGPTNGNLSFCDCRFSSRDTMRSWGHSNPTLRKRICLTFLHSQVAGRKTLGGRSKNFRRRVEKLTEKTYGWNFHKTNYSIRKQMQFSVEMKEEFKEALTLMTLPPMNPDLSRKKLKFILTRYWNDEGFSKQLPTTLPFAKYLWQITLLIYFFSFYSVFLFIK